MSFRTTNKFNTLSITHKHNFLLYFQDFYSEVAWRTYRFKMYVLKISQIREISGCVKQFQKSLKGLCQ